jgi:hypothetical protein
MDEADKIIKDWAQCFNGIMWTDNIPWFYENKLLKPLTMPHKISNVDRKKVREIIKSKSALVAYWTDNWDLGETEWWWTSCDDKEYDVENIEDKRGRRDVRKGIRECSVKKMIPEEFVKSTYPVYSNAYNSYKYHNLRNFSADQYREYIFNKSSFNGYELWGAFINERLAAYASVVILDDAVLIESAKSDPELQNHCPNNALFYIITKHYLNERNKKYITNGPRTLFHPTNINDMLIRMGYRKIYCQLNVELSLLAGLIKYSRIQKLFNLIRIEKFFPEQTAKLNSFFKLIEISKNF